MYRSNSELRSRATLVAFLTTLAFVLAIGGCTTPAGNRAEPVQEDNGAGQKAPAPEPVRPARVEVEDDVGFTVTEVVSITGDLRGRYREALSLLARDDFESGIALLVEVAERAPDATAPFVDLGIAYGRTGAFEKAEASFKHALASTPDHPVAHNELGIVYRKQGNFAAARQSYQQALEIYPGFHYARRNLAVLCDLYLADSECALEHYEIYRESVAKDREVDIWISDIRSRMAPAG